jgi:hypothetical protein
MTREIVDPPHPTPNPDGPHSPGKSYEATPIPAGPRPDADHAEEEPYDSVFDDLNQKLSESIEQPAPDPALGPGIADDGSFKPSRSDDARGRLIRSQKLSPRTSEVFKAVVALSAASSEPTPPGAEVHPAFFEGDSPDPESKSSAQSDAPLLSELVVERRESERESVPDDDLGGEGRFPWFQVFLLSYASAVTLALTWMVMIGRSPHLSDRFATTSTATSDPAPPQKPSASRLDGKTLPLIPDENIVTLGSALRVGDLQIRPLSVALQRVELVGSIDASKYRAEESESLVLRMQLTNLSKSQRFAPLELAYIREQSSPLDRCLITTPGSRTIGAFALDVFSEWSIVGQEARVLERGETLETIIASEPGASEQMKSDMTWRVRLRIGPFRTDVVGIRFKDHEVERDAKVCGIDKQ